jgi:3-isopropylmalate dehydrogenase
MIYLSTDPSRFDVIVTDNLFGDIITDLAAAITGGIGLAASGNVNPDRTAPSMFEPVHGSAPDIAGRGIANPAAAALSAALMLAALGQQDAALTLEAATARVLADLPVLAGERMGASTYEIGERIAGLVAVIDVPAPEKSLLAAMESVHTDATDPRRTTL